MTRRNPSEGRAGQPQLSDATVRTKTGRGWDDWVAHLNSSGAEQMTHAEIAKHLQEVEGLGAWWAQTVTVGYERITGRRAAGERPDGFSASTSKTVRVSARVAYEAWTDAQHRHAWLEDEGVAVERGTAARSVKARNADGTPVEVYLLAQGEDKTRVSVQHNRLPDEAAVREQKTYWKEALERFKAYVERA